MVGNEIDGYKIEKVLGKGGMGVVYKATDVSLDKVVAMKVMNPMLAQDPRFSSRFKSEARALGRLQHPNIVGVFAFRHIEQHLFIVMEFVEGGTITDRILKDGPFRWKDALPLMKQALRAIEYAHRGKVIHRDLKPRNILVTRDNIVKITDFGLAKIQIDTSESMVATRTGFTGGTLYYMPPEQLEGLPNVDHRGDIYSLGMTFYEMLAGRVPFNKGSSEFAILKAIDAHTFPALHEVNASVPQGLVDIVMKAVEKDPADRYQSAAEMLAALEKWGDAALRAPVDDTTTQVLKTPPALIPSLKKPTDFTAQPVQRPVTNTTTAKPTPPPKRRNRQSQAPTTASSRSSATSVASEVKTNKSKSPSKPKGWWILPATIAGMVAVVVLAIFFLISSEDENSVPSDSGNPPPVLASATTPLSIATFPQDAQVYLNNEPVGRTPLDDFNVEPGTTRLRLEREGYIPIDTTLIIREDERPALFFRLSESDEAPPSDSPVAGPSSSNPTPDQPATPATGTLFVQSRPSGATVRLGNRLIGTTPLTLNNADVGTFSLSVEQEGFSDFRESIRIREGATTTVEARLTPLIGTVEIIVRPFGDISIDGRVKAKTTDKAYSEQLAAGTHEVTAVHPQLGRWTKRVRVQGGQTHYVNFNFLPKYKITVTSQPRNAEILVDGRPTGDYTPKQISLHPGQHTISVRKQGYEMTGSARQITLEADQSTPLDFPLRAN